MDAVEERIAMNEALFREVNENISDAADDGRHVDAHFVCECGDSACEEKVVIRTGDYLSIRQNKRRFFVKPGHEKPQAETVVERRERYFVVEKPPETDPIIERFSD